MIYHIPLIYYGLRFKIYKCFLKPVKDVSIIVRKDVILEERYNIVLNDISKREKAPLDFINEMPSRFWEDLSP